jgi:hypothetical protein
MTAVRVTPDSFLATVGAQTKAARTFPFAPPRSLVEIV